MVCRHNPGDPSCTSGKANMPTYTAPAYNYERSYPPTPYVPPTETPDSEKYRIVDFTRVGKNVVLKILYPNCSHCAYEGNKVMVFLNVTEAMLMQWRKIDPHFRNKPHGADAAPSPAARFPASPEGWEDALDYAQRKS